MDLWPISYQTGIGFHENYSCYDFRSTLKLLTENSRVQQFSDKLCSNLEGNKYSSNFNGFIIIWILLQQIFMIYYEVNSEAGWNNDLPHPPSLLHPLHSYWINGPANKCEGILRAKLTTIFLLSKYPRIFYIYFNFNRFFVQ